ncbi:Rv3654c family TadE-like protein, partial [Streptomyces sp. ZG43]
MRPSGRDLLSTSTAPTGRDRGAATVWAAVASAALCAVFAALLAMGHAVAVRHQAGGVADLAALAAADHWGEGEEG